MNMSYKIPVFLLVIFAKGISEVAYAQEFTTLIIVRHAEKEDDGTPDPPLSENGKLRANRLAYMLNSQPVDIIYTTKFSRNTSTIYPVANSKGILIKIYEPHAEGFLEMVVKGDKGKTVLICGHSDTVPFMVNKLIGEDKFKQLDDNDYDNMFIVTITEIGKGAVTVINY